MKTDIHNQFRFPINQFSWEIPEGGGLLNTDPLQSAIIIYFIWTELLQLHLSNSVTNEKAIIFIRKI